MLVGLLVISVIMTLCLVVGAIYEKIEGGFVFVSLMGTAFILFLNFLVPVNRNISIIEPQSVSRCDVIGLTTVTYKMGDEFKSLVSDMASIYLADKNGIVVKEVIDLNIFGMEINRDYSIVVKEGL
jgi:hypothetical protein